MDLNIGNIPLSSPDEGRDLSADEAYKETEPSPTHAPLLSQRASPDQPEVSSPSHTINRQLTISARFVGGSQWLLALLK